MGQSPNKITKDKEQKMGLRPELDFGCQMGLRPNECLVWTLSDKTGVYSDDPFLHVDFKMKPELEFTPVQENLNNSFRRSLFS